MKMTLKLISKHEVFRSLTEVELKALDKIIEQRTYNRGEIIFDASKKSNYFYYVVSGSLTLRLSNNEYKKLLPGQLFGEIGVINADFRSGSIIADEATEVICICGEKLFQEDQVPPAIALKVVRALSKRITNYLRSREQVSTKEIINHGENDMVEFKSTLRWNIRAEKKDKAIEKTSLKTICAFMNTNGGTLLIGVKDDGTLLGLKEDRFANQDKMLLHLTKIIKERIGSLFMQFLDYDIELVDNKEVLRIDCTPATMPVYYKEDRMDHFFIRTGPSTTDLRLSKVYAYILERFEKKGGSK